MLVIEDIEKCFGDVSVLSGVNISIENGQVYTLTGGNGSGKTTLLNIISGFVKPTKGSISFKGCNLIGLSPYKINRMGIGRTFQDLRLAMQMTVKENVMLSLEKRMFERLSSKQLSKVDVILEKMSLTDKANELAGEISYGQQKLLTLACLLANDAELLLIDEPVAGIDKNNFTKIVDIILESKQIGKTIIQIEHHPQYIAATSDVILHMEKGKIVC